MSTSTSTKSEIIEAYAAELVDRLGELGLEVEVYRIITHTFGTATIYLTYGGQTLPYIVTGSPPPPIARGTISMLLTLLTLNMATGLGDDGSPWVDRHEIANRDALEAIDEVIGDDGRYNCFYPIENRDDYDEPIDTLVVSMPVIDRNTIASFKRADEYVIVGAMFDKDIVSRLALNPNVRISLYRTNPDTSWTNVLTLGFGVEADEKIAEEPSATAPFEGGSPGDGEGPGEEEPGEEVAPVSKRKSSSKKKGGKKK